MDKPGLSYKKAGVDIDAANQSVEYDQEMGRPYPTAGSACPGSVLSVDFLRWILANTRNRCWYPGLMG